MIDGKTWSAVVTQRNENIRIISVRRSRSTVASIKRPNREQKRVNVDFPTWMIESLDNEAARLGVTRQSIIKVWLAERLEALPTAKDK